MRIRIREARLQDREGILGIASHTWEGWDYVPLFLNDWLRRRGLFVAETEGRIIGMTKTSTLFPGELWLEGLRVAEEFRGQGIGERLANFQLKEALSRKPNSIRLSTAEVNRASIRIIEGMGFRLFSTYTRLQAKVREPKGFPPLRNISSSQKAWDVIKGSDFLRFSKGLLPAGWIFSQAREEQIAELVSSGMVLEREGGVAILQPHRYDPKNSSEIIFFSAPKGEISALLEGINSTAFQKGFKELSGFLPEGYGVESFAQWGFNPKLRFKYVFVYEYPLPG